MTSSDIYPGGMPAILARYEARRDNFDYAEGEAPPAADMQLTGLRSQTVIDPTRDPAEAPPFRSSYHRKRFQLRQEFQSKSELCFLNGLLISHLRKRDPAPHLADLFQRLWRTESTHLIEQLNPRWLVSAITTFGDHGQNDVQRALGLSMTSLFAMMKLYESERLFSGAPPTQAHALSNRQSASLPLEMDVYALINGGLDINLIARLWQEAIEDSVVRPLAHHLLSMLIQDERSILARLAQMRDLRSQQIKARDGNANPIPVPKGAAEIPANALRWGIVATVKAPQHDLARFLAHHLELGASHITIYLDAPNLEQAQALAHPKVSFVQCDEAYWTSTGKARMDTHQLRQLFNATHAYGRLGDQLDWLCHIDVDEFLHPTGAISDMLASVPEGDAMLRVLPVEALARDSGLPQAFKRAPHNLGKPDTLLQEVYPTFGDYLAGGFLSHRSGKTFLRTGCDGARFGVHTARYKGDRATNSFDAEDMMLLHLHAPSRASFEAKKAYRSENGAYQSPGRGKSLSLADLLSMLAAEGPEAEEAFYAEVIADSPALRALLDTHGLLAEVDFDPDSAVARVFGTLK